MRYFKTATSALLALSTALSPLALQEPAGAALGFSDLTKAAPWAKESILTAQHHNFMTGDPSGAFRPTEPVTRQEVAVILTRVLGLNTNTLTTRFTDVAQSSWANPHITAVLNAGLMSGDGGSQFRPTDNITRQELAVILVKAIGRGPSTNKLDIGDWDRVAPWAHSYVATAMEAGLLSGDGTNFNPTDLAQRQALAVTVMNLNRVLNGSTIHRVENGRVVIDHHMVYEVSRELKPLFTPDNQRALEGAKIRFVANKKRIEKIQYLELTKSGDPSPSIYDYTANAILHGGGVEIDGNVVVNANNVTLEQLKITGNLGVTSKHQAEFVADSISVEGQSHLESGGVWSAYSDLGSVRIKTNYFNMRMTGSSTAKEVNVLVPNATITNSSSIIPAVTLSSSVKKFETNSAITHLAVQGIDTKVLLTGSPFIESVTTANNRALTALLENYDKAKFFIARVNGTANPLASKTAPPIQALPTGPTSPTTPTIPVPQVPSTPTLPQTPSTPQTPPTVYARTTVSGVVRDELGRPMAGVELSLVDQVPDKPIGYAETDAQGRYTIANLPNGHYAVSVDEKYNLSNRSAKPRWVRGYMEINGQGTLTKDFAFHLSPRSNIDIPLVDTVTRTSITGRATPGTQLFFYHYDIFIGYAETDARGQFTTKFFSPVLYENDTYNDYELVTSIQDTFGNYGPTGVTFVDL